MQRTRLERNIFMGLDKTELAPGTNDAIETKEGADDCNRLVAVGTKLLRTACHGGSDLLDDAPTDCSASAKPIFPAAMAELVDALA